MHSYGKEAMMFLGDHWIGTEPFGAYFKISGLTPLSALWGRRYDAHDLGYQRCKLYRRAPAALLFPDVFTEGGDPIGEAQDNWLKARRAILRSP